MTPKTTSLECRFWRQSGLATLAFLGLLPPVGDDGIAGLYVQAGQFRLLAQPADIEGPIDLLLSLSLLPLQLVVVRLDLLPLLESPSEVQLFREVVAAGPDKPVDGL